MGSHRTYNGVSMPEFMYGTAWKKEETTRLVKLAVSSGFTAIDTANQIIHYDEARVGDALLDLSRQGIERESLFLQTKFTSAGGQDHRTPYDASADITTQVGQSFRSSLRHLHTDTLDSYVLHGPYSRMGLGAEDWEVWEAIEEIYKSGGTRVIGISNVSAEQLDELCRKAEVKPMVVQNRCFAVLGWDFRVREICRAHGIVYQGFSLLTANRPVLFHPRVREIAGRLGVGPAQVVFRFALEVGMQPLTGTSSRDHMLEDLAVRSLRLSREETTFIEAIALSRP